MNHILRIAFLSILFGLSLMMTLIMKTPDFRILPTESFEELNIMHPSDTPDFFVPDHAINPGNVNGIVVPGNRLIGGTSDNHWLAPSKIAPYLRSKQIYRAFSKTGFLSELHGSVKPDATGDNPHLVFEKIPSFEFQKNFAFAISGGWDAFPRKPQYINENLEKYHPLVEKVLAYLHLQAPAIIREIIQIDLTGDGTDELLIAAEHFPKLTEESDPKVLLEQSYSLILLYQVHDTRESTTVLIGSCREPIRYDILAVADLNGDWSMECLVRETLHSHASPKPRRHIIFGLEDKTPCKILECRWQP